MKPVKMAIAALALATLSFSVMAATLVDVAPANQQKIGVISACSSSNSLSSLQRELENKAKAAGQVPIVLSALPATTVCAVRPRFTTDCCP